MLGDPGAVSRAGLKGATKVCLKTFVRLFSRPDRPPLGLRGWENSRHLCKPSTSSRFCVTVENSPNPWGVYIRLCKHRKKIFYCFYKITLPRKNANSLLRSWLKEKFLPVAKSYTRSLARVISSCFAKRCFPKYGFFSLKMSAQTKKKLTQHVSKDFSSFNRRGNG